MNAVTTKLTPERPRHIAIVLLPILHYNYNQSVVWIRQQT